jgi:hypothetical protein
MTEIRRTLRFSPETDRQLEPLAKAMHAGNMTATIAELIRAEISRRSSVIAPKEVKPVRIPLLEEIGVLLMIEQRGHKLTDPILKASCGAITMSEATRIVREFNDELARDLEVRIEAFGDATKEIRRRQA